MIEISEQAILDFYMYPSVGDDDWRYTFGTAQVRALEMQMLNRATLLDMANSDSFETAVELLGSSEYALAQDDKSFASLGKKLLLQRTEVRKLFEDLTIDEPVAELLRSRQDFTNLRLALRRKLTEKPLGTDYSNEGNFPADQLEQVFEEDNYDLLPDYMQQASDSAVLAYYQNKEIRQIDYAVDSAQTEFNLRKAQQLNNIFLLGLFRLTVDLTNIHTMLRLKFTDAEQRNVFLEGGFVEIEVLKKALDVGYESMAVLFFATPYHEIVDLGTNYLASNQSFLKLEYNCEQYLIGYLKSTTQITAGVQPIIAYLLMKENEIRTVRLILTAKKNGLDTKLILDRLGE